MSLLARYSTKYHFILMIPKEKPVVKPHFLRWISTLALASALTASAQFPAKHPVTPEELVRLTQLSNIAISPDGSKVVYQTSHVDFPSSDKSIGHLYMVSTSGGIARQMTTSEAGESSPAWSPNGANLAFLSRRNGSPQIFVMAADGGEGLQLGKVKIVPRRLKWSPDGKLLAFLSTPEPSAAEKAEDEKTGGAEVMEAPHGVAQLFTLSFPEGKQEQVTKGNFNVSDFNWAPDGKSFALITATSQLLYDNMMESSVQVVDLKGKTLSILTSKPMPLEGPPEFSPDGTRVAWRYSTQGPSELDGVAVCGVDGKGFVNVASKVDLHFFQIHWSPDGKSLLTLTMEGTRACIRRLDLATGKATAIFSPTGVISDFQLDKDAKRFAIRFTDSETPTNAWSLNLDGTDAKQLTDLNPQVKNWVLPKVEKFQYESAKGISIEALCTRTPIMATTGIAPLMVMPHGGPDSMDQEAFNLWAVYMAGQGYNLLRVNFRGSLAYGRAFYAANRGNEGFVDYDDIMAGVDHLVAKGLADSNKLVIGGWSYGGCMSEWAITRTDRFKAAVVGAGVANYISNYAQSDINHGFNGEWEFLGNPYDNPGNYTKGSAVFHIRSVKTPGLILHGKDDERVPYVQGLELYRALKTTGKQVEMISYPGEGHGLIKPAHKIDRLKRWSAFYDKALGIQRPESRTNVNEANNKVAK